MIEDVLEIDDLVNELSNEEHLLVTYRALKAFSVPVEWVPREGGGHKIEVAVDDISDLTESEDFLEEMGDQYKRLIIPRITKAMEDKGILRADGVDADGEIVYKAA